MELKQAFVTVNSIMLVSIWILTSLIPLCIAQRAEFTDAGGLFIFYNGTISGQVTYSPPGNLTCGPKSLGSYSKAYFYAGVYPPWDKNPFFFELFHKRSEDMDSRPGGDTELEPPADEDTRRRKRQFVSLTYDDIFNLWFASADGYNCFEDGKPCGSVYHPDYAYFVGVDLLNLTAGTSKRVKVGSETGYTVTGDEKTWISNDTAWNTVDIATSCVQTRNGDEFRWNKSTPFTYNVTITNTTANAILTINKTSADSSQLILFYSGTRVPYYRSKGSNYYSINAPDNHSGNDGNVSIALDTSDPESPKFTYVNGSKIFFERSGKRWYPTATPARASRTSSRSPTTSAKRNSSGKLNLCRKLITLVVVVVVLVL